MPWRERRRRIEASGAARGCLLEPKTRRSVGRFYRTWGRAQASPLDADTDFGDASHRRIKHHQAPCPDSRSITYGRELAEKRGRRECGQE